MTHERSTPRGMLIPALAWALYDLANTIFSLNMHTLYFPRWLVNDLGGKDYHYTQALTVAMALVLLIAPPLGYLADALARRRMLLNLFTMVCIGCTLLLALPLNYYTVIVLFTIASAAYYLSNTFYDSLLPLVCTPQRQGLVSGLGVGIGYAGSILSLIVIGRYFIGSDEAPQLQGSFVPTALSFLIFALPCMLLVREGPPPRSEPGAKKYSLRDNWTGAMRLIVRTKGTAVFFLASFFLLNAVTTIYLNMALYLEEVGGFGEAALRDFMMYGTLIALAAAFPLGWASDRLHPKSVLLFIIVVWLVALLIIIPAREQRMFWFAAPLFGIGLAGAWTATRPLLLTLIPQSESATFFGFNALASRFAAIAGLGLWSIMLRVFEDRGPERYRIGLAALALLIFISLIIALYIPRRETQSAECQ